MVAFAQKIVMPLRRLQPIRWQLPADHWILLLLILAAVFMRLPYFFMSHEGRLWRYEMLYHDESLFLMHGRDVLHGHLPYIHHWDNRPPLGWFLFAIMNLISAENLVMFRINGALLIGLTSFMLFRIFAALGQRSTGVVAGLFYAIFCSVAQVGQSITTEHVVALPFVTMLYFVLSGRVVRRHRLIIGLLYAVCVMTLTNYLLLLPALALLLPGADGHAPAPPRWHGLAGLQIWRAELLQWVRRVVLNGLMLLGIVLTCYGALYMLYWINNQHDFLLRSLIDGAFTVSRQPMDERLLTQFGFRWEGFSKRFFFSYLYSAEWIIPLLMGVFLTRVLGALTEPRESRDVLSLKLTLLLVCGALALFFRGGNFWNFPYYILQVMPLLAMAMARAVMMRMRDLRIIMLVVLAVGLQAATARVLSNYKPLLAYMQGENKYSYMFMGDRNYQVAAELNRFQIAGKNMIVCTDDDSLFILTHAARVLGVRIEPLLEVVQRSEPVAIVGWRGDKCFSMLGKYLNEHYEMYSVVQNTHIYVRKDLLMKARGIE
ncbi:MAG: hypothetical protein EBV03_03730 [Proteobacteria bacterium]|nr:hypothetical protein [Pseudomonadota bacterium]